MPSALILIAHGTEEMEFTIVYDTLVRAGIHTTSAYVPLAETPPLASTGASWPDPPCAKCSRGLGIMFDACFERATCGPDRYDLLVIPGGAQGASTISKNADVQAVVRDYLAHDTGSSEDNRPTGKYVGMICAGSLTAMEAGLPRQPITSHPSVRAQLEKDFDYSEDPVVVSGCLITSRGPGTAFPFALALVEYLCGVEKRAEVQSPMVFPQGTPF